MTSEEIQELGEARESLCRRRSDLAKSIGRDPLAPIARAEELTKVLLAIEAVDRALNEAGQPYMSDRLRVEADSHSPPQPIR